MLITMRVIGGHLQAIQNHTMQFPAGEWHTKEPSPGLEPTTVFVHGTDANDYMAAAQIVDLNRSRGLDTHLVVPYLPAARSDRGVPFGAKHYADLINLVGASKVTCLDAHSPVMPTFVKNLTVIGLGEVIGELLDGSDYVGVIAPDAGAKARATAAADALGLPVYQALKHRDFETGHLDSFTCEELPETGRLLVVDDICDGGGTFRGLAEATGLGPDRLDLWVTHGVFSPRSTGLDEVFGTIHTTDSYGPRQNQTLRVTTHHVRALLAGASGTRTQSPALP